MNTLFVTNDFPPRAGGIEQYTLALIEGLDSSEITVIAPDQPGAASWDAGRDFEVIRLRGVGGRLWPSRALADFVTGIARARHVEVLAFPAMLPLAEIGPRVVEATSACFVVWHHGAELAGPARFPLIRYEMRRLAKAASIQFAVSDWTASETLRLLGRASPIRLLRVGIDTARFASADPTGVRSRHGLAGALVILCVGRLVPRKGQDTLIRVLPAIRRVAPETRLLLVGEGPYESRLRKMARENGMTKSVIFAGRVPDDELAAYYAAADIYASPVRTRRLGLEAEGFGVVFLEAAAAGLPVIAGRSGGSGEAVVDGETGLVVDGSSDAEVTSGLIRLIESEEARKKMGEAGKSRVEREFYLPQMGANFRRALLEEVGIG